MLRKRSDLPSACAVREPARAGLTARLPTIVGLAPARTPGGTVDSRPQPGIGPQRMRGHDAAVFGRTVSVDTRGQSCRTSANCLWRRGAWPLSSRSGNRPGGNGAADDGGGTIRRRGAGAYGRTSQAFIKTCSTDESLSARRRARGPPPHAVAVSPIRCGGDAGASARRGQCRSSIEVAAIGIFISAGEPIGRSVRDAAAAAGGVDDDPGRTGEP